MITQLSKYPTKTKPFKILLLSDFRIHSLYSDVRACHEGRSSQKAPYFNDSNLNTHYNGKPSFKVCGKTSRIAIFPSTNKLAENFLYPVSTYPPPLPLPKCIFKSIHAVVIKVIRCVKHMEMFVSVVIECQS